MPDKEESFSLKCYDVYVFINLIPREEHEDSITRRDDIRRYVKVCADSYEEARKLAEEDIKNRYASHLFYKVEIVNSYSHSFSVVEHGTILVNRDAENG